MRLLLSASFLAISISTAHAGPGASRMASPEMLNISKGVISRTYSGGFRMSKQLYPQMQRRSFSTKLRTKGYEPKEAPVVSEVHTLHLPKKLEYLDENYEVFRTPKDFEKMLEESMQHPHKKATSFTKEEKKK